MDELKLHSFGQRDHLATLKDKYDSLKRKIKGNPKLSKTEEIKELKKLTEAFKKEKRDSKNNLY